MLAVAGIRQASPWQPPAEIPAVSACCHSSGTEYGHSPKPGPIGGRIPSSTTSLICGRRHSKVPSDHLCSVCVCVCACVHACVRVCVCVCTCMLYTDIYIFIYISMYECTYIHVCTILCVFACANEVTHSYQRPP